MGEEKNNEAVSGSDTSEAQQPGGQTLNTEPKPKKKHRLLACSIVFFILLTLGFLAYRGVTYVNRQANSTADGPAGPPKNYVYPTPTAAAKERTIDCDTDLRLYKLHPKKVLCLNLHQTSAPELKSKLAAQSYDNVVLYGQNIIWDVDNNLEGKPENFAERIYNVGRFTDLITMPKLMALYGVKDMSFINKDYAPYPALYYEVRSQADVNKSCGSQYNIGGCSQFHFMIILLADSIYEKEQGSKWRSWSRNETDDHLYYRETIPSDCYVSNNISHEAAHTMLFARELKISGMSMSGNVNDAPRWFDEEQAGVTEFLTPQLVCGADIITELSGDFAREVREANWLKFQAVYPANIIRAGSPANDCQRAILTEYYKYLSIGNLEETMPSFMTELREKIKIKGYIENDRNFANLILKFLANNQEDKEFLNSKGCGI